MGSEVITELPTNWYENPSLLGFVVSCVYGYFLTIDGPSTYHHSFVLMNELNLHGNGFGFKDEYCITFWCECHCYFKDLIYQVWVWWYPKIAIPK